MAGSHFGSGYNRVYSGLSPGTFELEIRWGRNNRILKRLSLAAGEVKNVSYSLSSANTGEIRGRVVSPIPLGPGRRAWAVTAGADILTRGASGLRRSGSLDELGRYVIPGLEPGSWEVVVQSGRAILRIGMVSVKPGAVARLDTSLPVARVDLVLRDRKTGEPYEARIVKARIVQTQSPQRAVFSRASRSSKLVLERVWPGDYRVEVQASGCRPFETAFRLRKGETKARVVVNLELDSR